ncbi:phage head closure protein [Cohaesibacter gelatinilyticus]|nr:phage head closure protein [Cohaesibacter gelatinilyticus]
MRAGSMRDKVSFQRKTKVSDGGGGHEITWVVIAKVSGRLSLEKGGERVQAGRIEAPVSGVLVVRYSSDIAGLTSEDKAVIDDIDYNIKGQPVNRDRRKRELEMTVERGVAV